MKTCAHRHKNIKSNFTYNSPKQGLLWWLVAKNPPVSAENMGLIPGSERSPGEGNGNPLQFYCLGNSMARGAWQATVPGVIKESDMT